MAEKDKWIVASNFGTGLRPPMYDCHLVNAAVTHEAGVPKSYRKTVQRIDSDKLYTEEISVAALEELLILWGLTEAAEMVRKQMAKPAQRQPDAPKEMEEEEADKPKMDTLFD